MPRVPTFAEIGDRIRQERLSKGYDQSDLAKALQVSRPVITKIENGKKAINSVELKMIADFLNISIERLTESIEEETLLVRFRNETQTPSFISAVTEVETIIFTVISQIKLGSEERV